MKTNILIYQLILLMISISLTQSSSNCSKWINNSYFTLQGLENPVENVGIFPDNSEIYWNTCSKYVQTYTEQLNTYFVYQTSDGEDIILTGDSIKSAEEINEDNPEEGFIVHYSESITGNSFSLTLICDKNVQKIVYDDPPINIGKNHYIMSIISRAGCPEYQLSAIWSFLHQYRYIFIPILICFGFLNCFLGYKFFKQTLFSIGFLIGFFISLLISSIFIGAVVQSYINWITVILGILLGIGLGFVFYKLEKLGFFFLGAVGGFMLSVLFYESFLQDIFDQEYLVYLMYGIFLAIGGLLGLFLREYITILVTSFVGSYLLVRSASFFIAQGDYFPNEFTLAKMIQTGDYDIPDQFYYFLLAIFTLWMIAILIQCLIKSSTEKKNKVEKTKEIQQVLIVQPK